MDVLVIGGGPAGLAAAIAAREKGFEVTVADGAKPPIDKACGEGLMPNTLAALSELGVAIRPGDGRLFRGVRFVSGAASAEASLSGMAGLGVRRTVLHQKLVERAEECGVSLLWNTPVAGLVHGGAILRGTIVHATWIIGADGIRSRVGRWSGLNPDSLQSVRFAHRRHYRAKPWTDCMEIHWGKKMQVYVTPLNGEETCVVLISRRPELRFEDVWREFPTLAGYLGSAEVSSAERGSVTGTRSLRRVYEGNVALIGDASGSVDAITGEGLSLGFQQAMALATALEAGKLAGYQQAHRRLARRPNLMSRLLLLLDHSERLRQQTLAALGKDPGLFARMLAIHVGKTSPVHFAATTLRLGWQFMAA